jgi:hypothetical protein
LLIRADVMVRCRGAEKHQVGQDWAREFAEPSFFTQCQLVNSSPLLHHYCFTASHVDVEGVGTWPTATAPCLSVNLQTTTPEYVVYSMVHQRRSNKGCSICKQRKIKVQRPILALHSQLTWDSVTCPSHLAPNAGERVGRARASHHSRR